MSKYAIGDKFFNTKDELKKFTGAILKKYSVNEKVNKDDFVFLKNLLVNHPHYKEKTQHGIENIGIRGYYNNKYFSKYFVIISPNNIEIDFSYHECISPTTNNHKVKFTRQCREIISDQIYNFKFNLFKNNSVYCMSSGVKLNWEDCHIDHHTPKFRELLDNFILDNSIDIKNIKYDKTGLYDTLPEEIVIAFKEYHQKHAVLRPLHQTENLRLH